MKKINGIILLALVFLLSLGTPISIHSIGSGGNPLNNVGTLTILKLKTNATGISACSVNVSTATGGIVKATGTLFGNIRIVFNMTWTKSNQTYDIMLNSFFLVVTQSNIVVSNSTNINQDQNPTNTITDVTLFPNIPVILILSFKAVCVTTGSLSRVIYVDGTFNFVFNLP